MVEDFAGELPSSSLEDAIKSAQTEVQALQEQAVEEFHFDASWIQRLQRCYQDRVFNIERRNSELILAKWEALARSTAEEGSCFFLNRLATSLREYSATYGKAFSKPAQQRAVEFGSALQRTRLVECVRARDFLVPFAPWLAWPICSFYLRSGVGGLVHMFLHAIVLSGLYTCAGWFNQLPPYLDIDYRLLRSHPLLLGIVMRAPPLVPWGLFSRAFGLLGAIRTTWCFLRWFVYTMRSAGSGHTVGQLTNLELKLNTLLKRSEGILKEQLVSACFEATDSLEKGSARTAARALVKGLVVVSEIGNDDIVLSHIIEAPLRQIARKALESFPGLPPKDGPNAIRRCSDAWDEGEDDIVTLALAGNWEEVIPIMVEVLTELTQGSEGASIVESSTGMMSLMSASPTPVRRRRRSRSRSSCATASIEASPSPIDSMASPETVATDAVKSPKSLRPKALSFEDRTGLDESMDEGEAGNKSLDSSFMEGSSKCDSEEEDSDLEEEAPKDGFCSWLGPCAVVAAMLVTCGSSAALLMASSEAGLLPSDASAASVSF
eukprot:TRINITY_DN109724_c0_g1_i1.p1 TRINITY_DN109724_c0_g1~~TRINITY_DN109724_c0_g1_i1.p1  ORF type:complete len:589 (+),score=88.07 TRINITY_DN109724_c0_g1_i1:118-1767(+)